ncbi:uncharacterized protein LOC122563184 isoform X2 [Chiloscyllium plagiosum]|uniref:uncharacterized protein LOC122563184 isoform X2 n=1 Tax=Chiloscyllium plagiosum TaxID=36176 RepID=UPI001CB88592|nr:uncharacterized protein LOC122563184 isoform X2 [Chiloscyllium plagiosum]
MSITWNLINISKGQQFSLILCVLYLIVQWNCQCSAQHKITQPTSSEAMNNNVTDVPSTNASAPNTSTENSTGRLITNGPVNDNVTPDRPDHAETTATNQLPFTTKSESVKVKQPVKEHSKTGSPKVLISLLVCGLLLAAIILTAYYRMNKQTWSPQSKRLRTNQMRMRSQN